jgi:hypothetical protein
MSIHERTFVRDKTDAQRKNVVRKFEDSDFVDLQRLLAKSMSPDCYAKSSLYYALTGRGDVWALGKDQTIICTRHPNSREDLLVFFPFAKDPGELGDQIQMLPDHSDFLSGFARIFLARINKHDCDRLFLRNDKKREEIFMPRLKLRRIAEKTLDWIFPSYDISLPNLTSTAGAGLAIFRNKIRKFDSAEVRIVTLDKLAPREVTQAILDVSTSWARNKLARSGNKNPADKDLIDLVDPYIRLANLQYSSCRSLDGIFLRRGEEFIGFGLWELPSNPNDTVPAIAALPKSYEKGLSEYLHFQVAQKLHCRGFKGMCIGGSETESLDRFKRKLAPIAAHELCSVRLFVRSERFDPMRSLSLARQHA